MRTFIFFTLRLGPSIRALAPSLVPFILSGRIKEKPVGGTTRRGAEYRGAIGAEHRGAEGAEDRGAKGAEECGEGVSPSPPGEGAVPPPQKFFLILDHEIAFLAHSGRYILQFNCLLYAVLQ